MPLVLLNVSLRQSLSSRLLLTFSWQIWCLGNESRYHVNQSVDGSTYSVLISSLAPGIRYSVEVAASNAAGPGVKSDVTFFQLGKSEPPKKVGLIRKLSETWKQWQYRKVIS